MRLDRNLPVRALVTWTVLDPFPVAAVAYDPSAMAWLPVAMGRVLRPEPNRLDHTVGSAFPIVFDPATGFPWPPQIVPPRIARSSQGWTVLYPLGSGPVTIVPNLGQYTWQGFAPTIPELAVVAGGGRARAKIAYQQRDRRRIPEEQYFELTDDVVIVPGVGRIRWRGFAPALFITDVDEDHKIAMQMIDDPDIAQALLLAEQWLKGKKT